MEFDDGRRLDAATWKKTLFYVDLAVFAVFAIALILLVRHSFLAGRLYDRDEFALSTRTLWLVVADTAFLVASLGWIVYRFFSNQVQLMTRRF